MRFVFFRQKFNETSNPLYKWQLQSYAGLTGAKETVLAYCLVNTPWELIEDEKKKAQYWMNAIDPENNPEFIAKAKQIEINNIFDIELFKKQHPYCDLYNKEWSFDIPRDQRLYRQYFKRDDKAVDSIYQRVIDCRKFIKENFE